MKTQNLVLSGLLVLASFGASAKESLTVRFQLQSYTDYLEQSPGVFVGQTDHEKFSLRIDGVDKNGKATVESFGPELVEAPSTDRLTIQGDVIRSESKEGVTIVRASQNEDEYRVASSEMKRTMSEALKAKGKTFVTNLQMTSSEGDSGFKVEISDLVCKKGVPMVCSLSVDMLIRAEK